MRVFLLAKLIRRSPVAWVVALLVAMSQAQAQSPLHDPEIPEPAQLQTLDSAIPKGLRDKTGKPDWLKMLSVRAIQPRATLDGKGQMNTLDLDILMRNTKEMPWVKFPHRPHTEWLDCSNCHDQIFIAKAGANDINMGRIFRGEFCGVCHGRVAFQPFVACERCHSVPQGDIPAWWTNAPAR